MRGNTTVLLAVRGLEHVPNASGARPECRFGEGMGQAVPGTILPPSAARAQCAELAPECNASGVWAAGAALQYPGGARSWAAVDVEKLRAALGGGGGVAGGGAGGGGGRGGGPAEWLRRDAKCIDELLKPAKASSKPAVG